MASPVVSIFASGDYDAQVRRGIEVLRGGGVAVLPTETVYGAAAAIAHPDGRRRLSALRGEEGRPFTVHLAHPADSEQYLAEVGDYARRIMRKLWPGPVALVFDVPEARRKDVAKRWNVADGDLFDSNEITLRCPDHIVASDIIGGVDGPVALARSGAPSAGWSPQELAEDLGDKADLIFDAGPTRYSKPSTIIKVGSENYEILRQGVYDERIIDRLLRTTILFVCSGNTCRSAMSEGIARHVLARKLGVGEGELEKKGMNVMSAGSFAMPGARATPQGVEALREMGIDLSHHRSKPLTVELIHQADMIFTMSRNHAMAVTALVPAASEKVATLDPNGDIEDPIGGDTALYRDLAGRLQTLIERRLQEKTLP
ncbi:MAG TPA: Sua5/YciO/YrdC/YwlC family protein [Tepidisphaeraceae bacterium]|nr:Sua5/YciO/YrdC/YwlC family protein [Tepidisphaeraceae bacterium]